MKQIKTFFLFITFLASAVFAHAETVKWNKDAGSVFSSSSKYVIEGYDPVAYFTQKKAVKGDADFKAEYKGGTFLFSSKEHRDSFLANPDKYAPQFGGYCAWAVSQGYPARIDPQAWTVHGDKLYLNYSKGVRVKWSDGVEKNIKKGIRNWPKVHGAL